MGGTASSRRLGSIKGNEGKVTRYRGRVFFPLPGLLRVRNDRGYSQEKLAALSGVSVGTIIRIERGEMASLPTLGKLAVALEVDSLEELLLDDEGIRCLTAQKGDLVAT